jgi:hypothetical protein
MPRLGHNWNPTEEVMNCKQKEEFKVFGFWDQHRVFIFTPSLSVSDQKESPRQEIAILAMQRINPGLLRRQNGRFPLQIFLLIRYRKVGKVGYMHKYPMMIWTHQLSCCESFILLSVLIHTSFRWVPVCRGRCVSIFSSWYQSILHGRFGNLNDVLFLHSLNAVWNTPV